MGCVAFFWWKLYFAKLIHGVEWVTFAIIRTTAVHYHMSYFIHSSKRSAWSDRAKSSTHCRRCLFAWSIFFIVLTRIMVCQNVFYVRIWHRNINIKPLHDPDLWIYWVHMYRKPTPAPDISHTSYKWRIGIDFGLGQTWKKTLEEIILPTQMCTRQWNGRA